MGGAVALVVVLATSCGLDDVTGAPTDASATIDELVPECIELVKFQAFVGDAEAAATWQRVGATDAGLEAECRAIGAADPAALRAMGVELAELRTAAAQAAESADAAVTETTSPGCHSSYSDCVPIASDVDCAGHGDGPFFIELSVLVFDRDVYELDVDGDGLACEPSELG